ncbi:MAG: CAP domain-containing protein [bacterium]
MARTLILLALLMTACSDGFVTIESDGSDSSNNDGTPFTVEECVGVGAWCADSCVSLATDEMHCGACGVVCDGACVSGVCQPASDNTPTNNMGPDPTPEPEPEPEPEPMCQVGEMCGGVCVDTSNSFANCGTCGNACAGGQACISGSCMEVTEVQGVLAETNAARAAGQNCGVYGQYAPTGPLALDDNLNIAAQAHAADMSTNNFFSHTGSDGSSFVVRIGRTAFSGTPIGENIAAGQRSPAQVVAGWVDSDGHCRNLMNPQATKIGIGYTTGGPYGTLWVQVFGR